MKSSATGERGTRGADFFRRRGGSPARGEKLFTSFTDSSTFCDPRIHAVTVRITLSLSVRVTVAGSVLSCVGCVHPCARLWGDSWRAWGDVRARLRWPLAVAINTCRTSAPVDFGQSFAGESVRLRGSGGGREAATARARRAAERTLRLGWVGFKAAEG
ncbi:hypothetical protein K1T71_009679 [Dendrolimus kikuchii]|uniref:Uncharacterized protein n=1 Tax=Dendrolimus kikuchii TaxID=765133 RepID=A0ACC1CSE3_9NEOP|nr:hypothetical protein K1T71_009679 [Dendrolimus kikuchii]